MDVLGISTADWRAPFCFATSTDNGVTWSQVKFPYFPQSIGRYVSQPIDSIVRAKDGTI